MSKVERKTEVYSIGVRNKKTLKDIEKNINFDIILKMFFKDNSVHKVKNDKIYWFDYCEINNDVIKIVLNYSKYNKNVSIIDVSTLAVTKTKNKNEGDLEKQHILIKILKKNRAIMIFERVVQGIYTKSIEEEINNFIKQNMKQNLQLFEEIAVSLDNNIKDINDVEFYIRSVPNKDYLNELQNMKRISLIKVVVDKEKAKLDDDIEFSERTITRQEYDIIYKPVRGLSFSNIKVGDYVKKYLNGENDKIKRIIVEGKNNEGKIKLDTDGIKLNKYIETYLDDDGHINSKDLLNKYEKFVNQEFDEYLSNIILEGDDDRIGDD
ncbi:MAG: hypothetical protein KatS3mg079_237 [Caloramator sp.]|nr:MAG: hypothetical protein KatS3mg079_237 [Caloramator sp.]